MINSPKTLEEWLHYTTHLHSQEIDLGLDRIVLVLQRLAITKPKTLITVGGTNGKGSTCAFLGSILQQAGFRVGLYSSPHLVNFRERILIDGQWLASEQLLSAFEEVERARHDISLTPFEFWTLVMACVFQRADLDVWVLEVGLGGRLDAVNIFDPDCAVLTTVDLDHSQWLGNTREQIGEEKSGIFRANGLVVCGDSNPPQSVRKRVEILEAEALWFGHEFSIRIHDGGLWDFTVRDVHWLGLPSPALVGSFQYQNAACALAVLYQLRNQLTVTQAHCRCGLTLATLAGRYQKIQNHPLVVVDVAHNVQAALVLRDLLVQEAIPGKLYAVFGMMKDKNIVEVIKSMGDVFTEWFLAPLGEPRGASVEQLLQSAPNIQARAYPSVSEAYLAALAVATPFDMIVVWGSFVTVAQVLVLVKASRA